jgi:hypothetical protein
MVSLWVLKSKSTMRLHKMQFELFFLLMCSLSLSLWYLVPLKEWCRLRSIGEEDQELEKKLVQEELT